MTKTIALEVHHLLLLTVVGLLLVGLVMVTSASFEIAEATYNDAFYFLKRHLIYILIGCMCCYVFKSIPVDFWLRLAPSLLVISFILLVLVLIPQIGREVNGSRRWISLGLFTLQPSELTKLFVVMFFAAHLSRKFTADSESWWIFLRPILIMLPVVFLLLLEPDFGAAVIVIFTVVGLVFLTGISWPKICVIVSFLAVFSIVLAVLEPYRMQRILSFMDPWTDQYDFGYQLTQSLIAFGRGGWVGVGLGESIQKLFYLPEAHTDFVFAVVAEEFGLVGSSVLIVLLMTLVTCAFLIGRKAMLLENAFAAYLAYGIGFILGAQGLINLGVNVGVLPTKGLTLPLVSYGGTSLLVCLMMVGILYRIAQDNMRQ